jgi:SAM-dependent methyltransferase
MPLTETVARYYATLAKEYDTLAGYTDALAGELREPIKARFQAALRGHKVLEIACGTGYWTEVIAGAAESVLATDVDPTMISLARHRLARRSNVRCQVADAYTLDGVQEDFTAAFSHWWWSHVPKSRLRGFLGVLHEKLTPGALVIFADQLRYDWARRREDQDGNLLEQRALPDGSQWEIVKNFPTEDEIISQLRGIAEPVLYREYPEGRYWAVTYNTRGNRQQVA